MSPLLRKLGVALLAACAGAIGNAIGTVAADTIKETFAPKPEPTSKRKRGAR